MIEPEVTAENRSAFYLEVKEKLQRRTLFEVIKATSNDVADHFRGVQIIASSMERWIKQKPKFFRFYWRRRYNVKSFTKNLDPLEIGELIDYIYELEGVKKK